nr:alpha/beta hydrolase [Paenibacillus sp. DMB5]
MGESEPLALEDLVEDCEQLRKELGIAKWSVLGHSFGGLLGVRYAGKYPDSVESLILEGPSLDLPKSLQSWLRKAAGLYESLWKSEQANACLTAAEDNRPPLELLHSFFELGQGLGELRMKVYTPNDGNNYTEMQYSSSETEEFGRRSFIHLSKLMEEGRMFDPVLPVLKNLKVAVLLIKGRYDPITCEEQTRSFVENTLNGTLKIYEDCGHLPHFEAPDRFAEDVIQFVTHP